MSTEHKESLWRDPSLRDFMNWLLEGNSARAAVLCAGAELNLLLDVEEVPDLYIVKASVPGFKPEDLNVSVTSYTLTIQAEHVDDVHNYWLRERPVGTFKRTITLPIAVEANQAQARCENGELIVTLPKVEQGKPQQIQVTGQSQRQLSSNATSPEENKAVVRRWIEYLFNQGNLDVADELFAPNYVYHDPAVPGLPTGPNAMKQITFLYHSAFPDAHIVIEDQVTEGNTVVTRWTGRGTRLGRDILPGKQVVVTGIQIDRIVAGKIVEEWVNWDTLGVMQQLGMIPGLEEVNISTHEAVVAAEEELSLESGEGNVASNNS